VVLGMPGCYRHTVEAISRHPKDWNRLTILWDHLLGQQLPAVLLYLVCLPAVLRASAEVRRRFLHYHAVLLPVIAVQVLAHVKNGGGGENSSYNMELVLSLLLPVAVWAGASRLSRAHPAWQAAMIALFSGVGADVSREAEERVVAGRDDSWAQVAAASAELRRVATPGPVFAQEERSWAVLGAGSRIATGCFSLWHYAMADSQMKDPRWLAPVETALRERRYTAVQSVCLQPLPDRVTRRLRPLISAGYATPPGGGDWLVPRP
jgi:hypothetical protein